MMRRILDKVGGRRGGLFLLAGAATAAGIALVVVAVAAQVSVPQVPASARGTLQVAPSPTVASRPSPTGPEPTPTGHPAKPLPPSRPVHVSIPAIGVDSPVFPIGKNPDGTLAVPQPGPRLDQVAWYENSPTPGQPGPSVIEGHVDTMEGPSVFLRLGDVRPGDKIKITRRDGVQVIFTVNAVRDYKKTRFPTRLVYGGRGAEPTLRVITCSDFDASIGHHIGNEVVFAHLTAVRKRHGTA